MTWPPTALAAACLAGLLATTGCATTAEERAAYREDAVSALESGLGEARAAEMGPAEEDARRTGSTRSRCSGPP